MLAHEITSLNRRRYSMKALLALIAGGLYPLAFAPYGWWPLCFISIAILFCLWMYSERGVATRLGFMFGIGMFGVGTSWVYNSLHHFGNMPSVLAVLCTAVFVLVLSLFPTAAGYLQACFRKKSHHNQAIIARAIFIMPACWLFFEWLRGFFLTGFPWLTTGYAMIDTPIAAFAPIGGVYLVGMLALLTTGAVVAALLDLSKGGALALFILVLVWFEGWQLTGAAWTTAHNDPISVAIVQNNVPLQLKWDVGHQQRIIDDYFTQSALHRDVDLVVWPEAAVSDYIDRLQLDFYQKIQSHPADFIFGILSRKQSDDGWLSYNSVAAIGAQTTMYHKRQLVPFGEFIPLPSLFQPLMQMADIPMSNFTQGAIQQNPVLAAGTSFAVSICYEEAFPRFGHREIPNTGVLLNVSEDSWFGDSLAPHQRLQMARFRALESGRPMIRASNNGLSGVIDWLGGRDMIAPQFVKTVVTAQVQPRTGTTLYVMYGDYPILFIALILLISGFFSARKLW